MGKNWRQNNHFISIFVVVVCKNMLKKLYITFFILISIACIARSQTVYRLEDFGWNHANTGIERAKVIYKAQSIAVKSGSYIDYSGIKEVDLEISSDFESIPLSGNEDFNGIVFNVTNKAKNAVLFRLVQNTNSIHIKKTLLDGIDFGEIEQFLKGEILLIVEDKTPWVDNRIGYDYGHTRKDVILIKNGKGQNRVIAPYNTRLSSAECSYCVVSPRVKTIKNLTINRCKESTFRTFCIDVQNQAHVVISGVKINTPENSFYGDFAIRIRDCADVILKDIIINGTYSQTDRYGYGIELNNIWKTVFDNVCGIAKWGVMGTKNVNDIKLINCKLNRFDIHCYGKNVHLINSVFDGGENGWFCGGASIFGVIQYDKCVFTNCYPLRYTDSYKTAVGTEVIFNDCIFNATPLKRSVFFTGALSEANNPREGLTQKCLPNITINNMTINVPSDVHLVTLYDFGKSNTRKKTITYPGEVGYINRVTISGLRIVRENENDAMSFRLFSEPILSSHPIYVTITDSYMPGTTIINTQFSLKKMSSLKIKDSVLKKIKKQNRKNVVQVKRCQFE